MPGRISRSLNETGLENVCGANDGEEEVEEAGDGGGEGGGAAIEGVAEASGSEKEGSRYHDRD